METYKIKLKDTFSGSILTKSVPLNEAQVNGICKDIETKRIVLNKFDKSQGIHYTYIVIGIEIDKD